MQFKLLTLSVLLGTGLAAPAEVPTGVYPTGTHGGEHRPTGTPGAGHHPTGTHGGQPHPTGQHPPWSTGTGFAALAEAPRGTGAHEGEHNRTGSHGGEHRPTGTHVGEPHPTGQAPPWSTGTSGTGFAALAEVPRGTGTSGEEPYPTGEAPPWPTGTGSPWKRLAGQNGRPHHQPGENHTHPEPSMRAKPATNQARAMFMKNAPWRV